ncbi:MAG: transcription-repair coupling factor, partial [Lachnospiraceae bacterium]|nr:transcription-repair coupling factor [Lachnospiraceae bacterium]
MKAFVEPLYELAEFEEIRKKSKTDGGMLLLSGCVTSQKAHMMYALSEGFRHKLIICASESKAKEIFEEYRFLDSDIYYYPAKDLLFYQADIRGKELIRERMEVLQAWMEEEQLTVVTSFDSFMDSLIPPEEMKKRVIRIGAADELDLQSMEECLVKFGYDREVQIEAPGQFAVRGGILDIYPLTEEVPIRIELWGDEVDSI